MDDRGSIKNRDKILYIPGSGHTRYMVTCECMYHSWDAEGRTGGRDIRFFDLDKKGDEWVVVGAGSGP